MKIGVYEETSDRFLLEFENLVAFGIDFSGRDISIARGSDTSENTIEHLLLDQVWPRLLAHECKLVLHAAGISTEQGAILALGPSGRGKSTLAATLHSLGHGLLGDDAMIIAEKQGKPTCQALYPSLRLFPDSIATVFKKPVTEPAVAQYTDKRNLRVASNPADEETPQPIRAIFFIAPDCGDTDPQASALRPSEACMLFVEHCFWLDPTNIEQAAARLLEAGRLADSTPCFELRYSRDFTRTLELHAAMFAAMADAAG